MGLKIKKGKSNALLMLFPLTLIRVKIRRLHEREKDSLSKFKQK